MTKHCSTGLAVAFALLAAAAPAAGSTDDDQFREDVLHCEEALAVLARCCPAFDPKKVVCGYHFEESRGCIYSNEIDRRTVTPALSLVESDCIRGSSCDGLLERHVCERAQTAAPYERDYHKPDDQDLEEHPSMVAGDSVVATHDPVCP